MLNFCHISVRLSALLLLLCAAVPSHAALHYGFRHIGSDEGLSASNVKAITQDSNGFIWLGTKSGLDRFDGISIRSFNCHDDLSARGNNNISAIYEDADRNLWVGTDRGVYIFNPRTESFSVLDAESRNGVSAQDWVQTITGDHNGNIWMLLPNQGVFRYKDGKIEYYSVTAHNGDKEKLPLSMLVTENGSIYVGTNRQGLYIYDQQANMFRKVNGAGNEYKILDNVTMQYLVELPDGCLCTSSLKGEILHICPSTSTIMPVPFSKRDKLLVYSMECIDNEIWCGTSEGIHTIDIKSGKENEISKHTMGQRSLSDNMITTFFVDRDGNVWAGTMFGGVNFIQRNGLVIEKYSADLTRRGLTGNYVRGLAVDDAGKVWIGTEEAGLNMLDPETGDITRLAATSPDKKITLCLEAIDDKIYAGFVQGGCSIMQNGKLKENIGTDLLQSVNDVYSVLQDNAGNLWLGASWGLFRRDKGEKSFRQIDNVGYSWVHDMIQDSKGIIWIATMGSGIWSYNPINDSWHHYDYDEAHTNGLRSNSISAVTEDSKGRLWFSTDRGGLVLFNPESDTFTSYGIESGLPDDTVYDVIEDSLGFLWFGTNRGLVKFNPETCEVKIFSKGNNQFNYHSVAKTADGRFYMGGINGLITFIPEADESTPRNQPIYITDFRMADAENGASPAIDVLSESVLYSDHIVLPSDARQFSLCIGSPIYVAHANECFMYRLMPTGDEWAMVSDPSNMSFTGISPGDYTLEIKRIGDDSAVRTLGITVLAPWYKTTLAKIIYILVFLALVVFGWAVYRRTQLHKLAEKEEIFTIEKEKELYKKKMQFFTEIAHEIRTPLTLIGTPLEAIEEIGVHDPRIERYLKVIRQNTSRLLDLTGQMLDFQKMDSETHALKFETADINTLVQDIINRFEMTISTQNKELLCRLPEHQVLAKVDKDAVIKIVSNLFNNAMKYSDHRIEISLTTTDTDFVVSVKSDGAKIAGQNRYKIFEPFYQANNMTDNRGVGIGLPLCRTLAHLHGGTIELVDDDEPDSNTFRLTLPLKADIDEPATDVSPVMAEYVMEDDSPVMSNNLSYSLLFVDDNDEMREFLYDQLSKDFVVETACDGEEALSKLREHSFDIVVTDIMMPVMDGYELCKAMKDDPNLSPIPVVFLTAKNDLESKVHALECGGESYIEKPFSIKYFRQQIRSLLDNRRHERKAFLNKPFFTVDNMKMNKSDEEFMNKVITVINENIANDSFNVESMTDIFCMSRSSLLRKIKNLFNLSPIELIRIVRLKKAAELIQEGKYRMGDICFMVGINSQSYFTRLFYKQFSITPKAFEKQCQEKRQNEININNTDITQE